MSKDFSNKQASTQPQVTWGPLSGILLIVLGFSVVPLLAGAGIGLVLGLSGFSSEQAEQFVQTVSGNFIFALLMSAWSLLTVWIFLKIKKSGFSALGFSRLPDWRDFGYIVGGFVAYFALLILVTSLASAFLPIDTEQAQDTGFNHAAGYGMLMAFFALVILPPVIEEVLFRGYLFGGLRKKFRFWWATAITSVVFGAVHLLTGFEGDGLLWIAAIDTFVLSILLCYVREKTGALWSSIGVHALKNSLAFIYLFGNF